MSKKLVVEIDKVLPPQITGKRILLVLEGVKGEIVSAVAKHGYKNTPLNEKMDIRDSYIILAEEVGEVARAIQEGDNDNLEAELIQVAAMAVATLAGLLGR